MRISNYKDYEMILQDLNMLNWVPSTNNKDMDGKGSGLSLISTRKVTFSGAILVFLACLALAATTCFSPIWNFSPKSYWRPAKGDASVEYTNQPKNHETTGTCFMNFCFKTASEVS